MSKDPSAIAVAQRLHPKLRMIREADARANALRSKASGVVRTSGGSAKRSGGVRTYDEAVLEEAPADSGALEGLAEDSPEAARAADIRVSVFVEMDGAAGDGAEVPAETARRGNLVTSEVPVAELGDLAARPGIAYVSVGDALSAPTPVVAARAVDEPDSRAVDSSRGAGVILGFIDVGGFDFAHPDFLDESGKTTRFARIWDQGAAVGAAPERWGYGAELDGTLLNKAIAWGEKNGAGATSLVRQSVQSAGAHATHVASIAGGRLGLCPRAILAGVLIDLPPEDRDRRRSFYDSTRIAHAVEYLFGLGSVLAKETGSDRDLPVVINISLGTNGHAHDGSSPISRWIDAALTVPGRSVCVAAGNAGQEAPQFAGDIGQFSGRIHSAGRIAATGLETDVEWRVVGNGIADGSENEMEIWYEPQDQFEVSLRSPSGQWIGPVRPGQYVQGRRLGSEGAATRVSIYNERYHAHNGANLISLFLSPQLEPPVAGVEAGTWLVRLGGCQVRDGRFDAWIERDDPRPLGRRGKKETWRFPSYFSRRSNVDRSSVNSLASGHRILSVANYDPANERIHPSSSQGPTRDRRQKPEVAAPGTEVEAARGFSPPHSPWVAMTGTSMASPYVAGVAALMLAHQPTLTAAQIVGIMRRTAQPLPGADYSWQEGAGFGCIRPHRCLEEADAAFEQKELTDEA